MSNLNVVDIVILLIFFSSILIGFIRGFITEIVSLAAVICAFIVAAMFAGPLAAMMTNSSSVQSVVSQTTSAIGVNTAQPISYAAIGISFALLFTCVIIVGAIVKSILNIAFQTGILGFGNRVLGAAFGFAKGFILNLVLIFLFQLSPFASQPWWQQSQYVKDFQPAVQWLGNLVSPALSNIKARFGNTLQDINSSVQNVGNSL